jgi:transposase-like protein
MIDLSQFVEEGSTVFTDELNSYNRLADMGYNHKICNHGQLQYVVDGETYTNSIEGFWSHFRRMISCCYHDVSDERLPSYIDEAVYRWNTRKASQSERFEDMFAKSIGLIVTWSELRLCEAS